MITEKNKIIVTVVLGGVFSTFSFAQCGDGSYYGDTPCDAATSLGTLSCTTDGGGAAACGASTGAGLDGGCGCPTSFCAATTSGAGCSYGNTSGGWGNGYCAGFTTGNDVWFKFVMGPGKTSCNISITRKGTCSTYLNQKLYSYSGGGCSLGGSFTEKNSCVRQSFNIVCCETNSYAGLTARTTYYIRVMFESSTCDFHICVDKGGALPIELLGFNAFPLSAKEIQVNWLTATETNNDYFTIERSLAPSPSGEGWGEVGTVKGAGNSSIQKKYSLLDTDPAIGTSYYRLKQTDFDGKYEIFNPVSVNFDPNNVEWFFVNPNIISSSDKINLELTNLPPGNDVVIHLYGLQGKAVYSNLIPLDVNGKGLITSLALPAHLSSGMYALNVSCGNRTGVKKIAVR